MSLKLTKVCPIFVRIESGADYFTESDEEDDEVQEDEEEGLPPALKGDRNSQLTVGYKGDRSYVVRGNNIGVFNHSTDSGVKYYATITKIATPKGKGFKPQHVRLMK